MKYLLSIMLTFSLAASAANKLGSQCGLLDTNESDDWKVASDTLSLNGSSDPKIKTLATLTKQQLIISAKYFAKQDGSEVEIKNTQQAVEYLSGPDGLTVSSVTVGNKHLTEVMYFPGENPYSVVFMAGTIHVLAYGKDGTVYCK